MEVSRKKEKEEMEAKMEIVHEDFLSKLDTNQEMQRPTGKPTRKKGRKTKASCWP
jgi:hypothetical protein